LHALHAAKVFTHSVAQGVYPRLRALEHDVTKTIPKELKRTREIAKAAEAEAAKAWDLVKTHPWEVATAAFAGAVAIALDTLGATGIKCNAFRNLFGNRGCGLWNGLEEMLGLLVDTALLLNICNLIGPLEAVVSDVATPVVVTLTDIGAGLCSGGIGAPDNLAVPHLSLPTNPGYTLNLP
jgi:ElaB/YqjD/DUF883 family membrane-anchored ribosome-binding protein